MGHGDVKPVLDKLAAIRDFPQPRKWKELRGFLGLSWYYRRFIDKHALRAKPLTVLTSEKEPFIWGDEQEKSFKVLQESLVKC